MGHLLAEESRSPAGGAETQILLVARALARRGVKVRLLVFELPGVAIPESVDDVAVTVRPPYRAHERFGKLRETVTIGRTIARADADVVVSRVSAPEVGLAGLFTKVSGRKFIYSSANVSDFVKARPDGTPGREALSRRPPTHPTTDLELDFSRFSRRRREWQLFQFGVRLADEVVVQTEEQVRLCEERFGRSPVLIRSIAELAPQRECEPEAFLWIARLVSYKRPLAYIELARSLPGAKFWMVAVPPEHAPDTDLLAAVDRATTSVPNLQLLAPRPRRDLMGLIDRAVAIVNTADFEGMPNIFLEGWARGVPALAFGHDPDGVIERHGLGAFAHGSAEGLAKLAFRLWQDRQDQADVAERCRRYILDYHSVEAVGAGWQEVLGIASSRTPAEAVAV